MDLPDFDRMAGWASDEVDKLKALINPHSDEWKVIRRYLMIRRWQLGDTILRGGPPEAVEHARGKARICEELLTLSGQSDSEG